MEILQNKVHYSKHCSNIGLLVNSFRGGVNSKGRTKGRINSEVCIRGGVNSDHTANGVSTEQGTLKQGL